jgi:hypothetical protein
MILTGLTIICNAKLQSKFDSLVTHQTASAKFIHNLWGWFLQGSAAKRP